jgi:cytochrome c peroxidase
MIVFKFALCLALPIAQPLPQAGDGWSERELKIIQSLSPSLQVAPLPASKSNRVADDPAAAELGRLLFFEESLSPGGKVSCATCHDPEMGWSDGKPLSKGVGVVNFHAPTVLNAAYTQWQFWDGRADSLWCQALQPVESAVEMNSSRTFVLHQIAADAKLRGAWEKVFGDFPDLANRSRFPVHAFPPEPDPEDPFGVNNNSSDPRHQAWARMSAEDQELINVNFANFGKAIEAFERKLVTGPAKFDVYAASLRGEVVVGEVAIHHTTDNEPFSKSAQRGLKLFIGKGQCINCHFGPNLSDGEFHNIGLASPEGSEPTDQARPDGIRKLRLNPFNGRGKFSDASTWDDNQHLLYMFYNEHTYGAYKTPSLRNVSRTAPYTHDGRFADLQQMMEFYSKLPGEPLVGHREETLLPLNFSQQEITDLISFLTSLEGQRVPAVLRSGQSF